jgi:hypothetical protein
MVSQDYATELPKKIVEWIKTGGTLLNSSGDYLEFSFSPPERAQEIADEYRKYEKNLYRSNHRKTLMSMSGGIYEKSDLEKIFEFQDGRCYFTGKPLNKHLKNYSVDHLKPVSVGGSTWPANVALVLKSVNQDKHGRSAIAYWNHLAKIHGNDWVKERKLACKRIDAERRKLSDQRKKIVKNEIDTVSKELQDVYPESYVLLELDSKDDLTLYVEDIIVLFPKGVIRQKKKIKKSDYFKRIINGILQK